jgi:hypothetical protein
MGFYERYQLLSLIVIEEGNGASRLDRRLYLTAASYLIEPKKNIDIFEPR